MANLCLKDGTHVPGATTIAGMLDKPFLVKWANKLGKQGIDVTEYVTATAKKGTLIHEIVESHILHKEIDLSNFTDAEIHEAEKAFYKYLEWEKLHEVEKIEIELGLVSEEYKYCGIIDFYCKLDGKYTIVDFKTSKSISNEHFLQVSSYVQLLKENNYPVDQIMVLNIPRDDTIDFKTEYMKLESCEVYFEMFKNLLNVYYLKKRLG